MELKRLNKKIKRNGYNLSPEGRKRKSESSRKQMILNNPMKNESSRIKVSLRKKGINTNPKNNFKKGNNFKGFKNKTHSLATRAKISIKNSEHLRKVSKPFKPGHTAWNKGLTKDTDERVKQISSSLNGKKKSGAHRLKLIKNLQNKKGGLKI